MQPATVGSVLGNFAGATFADNAGATTFFYQGGRFMLRTAGPDGKLHQYQVKFTFGVSPIQQYLVELPGGRLQAFDVAWDSRPATKGGQRWFSLNPQSKPGLAARAQWATIDQNWNSMCADCHSTNVRKNYDSSGRTYNTTYAEVDVGCEACHGPGSAHLAWARLPSDRRARDPNHGLTVSFDQRLGIGWTFDSESDEVMRSRAPSDDREVETCARCHSRRTEIHEDYVHGQSLGDDYRVALLDDGLYFPDGQIQGEVYEYGSFVQSRMFHEGVSCSDCHDPHSLRLRAEGNSLCTRCHIAARYDSPRHHFHATGSAGARCIDCHMPARTFMLIDQRRDHSFRVPRPDLSIALGTPNTCNDCHSDKDPSWAEAQMRKWYSKRSDGFQRFGSALFAGRRGAPGAATTVTQLALDSAQPAIARATALAALADLSQHVRAEVLARSSKEKSEVIRRGAADMLASANPEDGPAIARLLNDRVRSVRIEAAAALAGAAAARDQRTEVVEAFARASAEYVKAQQLDTDRPEAHLNLGIFYADSGKVERAEAELRTALSIDPSFSPAAVNLADLLSRSGHVDSAQAVLLEAMGHAADDASLPYALGLLRVRQGKIAEALDLFASAVRLAPSNPEYGYVYAVALNDSGNSIAAIEALERSVRRNPYHRESLAMLVSLYNRAGQREKALECERVLHDLAQNGRSSSQNVNPE